MLIEEVKLVKVNDGTKNSFRVPKKAWNGWSEHARSVFNEVISSMLHNQEFFAHPKKSKVQTPEAWKTTAWNAAWTAADAVMRFKREKLNGKR